jgi:hypothetical protein
MANNLPVGFFAPLNSGYLLDWKQRFQKDSQKRRVKRNSNKQASGGGKKKPHGIKAMLACLVTIPESPLQSPIKLARQGCQPVTAD